MTDTANLADHRPSPTPPRGVDSLAILVVYYLKDDTDLPLLRLHLERITRHTTVPYKVFGVANRVTPAAREALARVPNLVLYDLPETDLRASREHGHYLDLLMRRALDEGYSHVCTLDVDSFPIDDSWVDALVDRAPPESTLTGVLRTENGDTVLPHPSCILATREFFEQYQPTFSPDTDGTRRFRQFLHATGQPADTGIQLGYLLWRERLPWGQLLRTNVTNPHYLMAGVYGDVVFHLGSVGRGALFRRDLTRSRAHRVNLALDRVPLPWNRLQRAKSGALHRLRLETMDRAQYENRTAYVLLREWLFGDPDSLFAYLRGECTAEQTDGWAELVAVNPPVPTGPTR